MLSRMVSCAPIGRSCMQVPVPLYFMTHAYFAFYHVVANYCIRRARRALEPQGSWVQALGEAGVVFVLAYAMAFGETLTIASFPHYRFSVRCASSPACCVSLIRC